MSEAVLWNCPWCGHDQMANRQGWRSLPVCTEKEIGKYAGLRIVVSWTTCLNPKCREVSVHASMEEVDVNMSVRGPQGPLVRKVGDLDRWQLWPNSRAKPWPGYVPEAVRSSYEQACFCEKQAPAASATMARRALHEMLKDFCGAKGKNLKEDIETLKKHVAAGKGPDGVLPESVDRLDNLREMGNIGAHLERGTNEIIIDIEKEEPRVLIEMIELLLEQWYVQREQRRTLNKRFDEVIATKKNQIVAPKT